MKPYHVKKKETKWERYDSSGEAKQPKTRKEKAQRITGTIRGKNNGLLSTTKGKCVSDASRSGTGKTWNKHSSRKKRNQNQKKTILSTRKARRKIGQEAFDLKGS